MDYRVAIQVDASLPWQWQSTALSSLNILLQGLQYDRAFPHDRLGIFSSSSREASNESLLRENQGRLSTSVPATQFLQERRIVPQGNEQTASMTAGSRPLPYESSRSPLEKRREELERGASDDHDLLSQFMLPTSLPQVLAWVKLLARVQQGDLQGEVAACGSGNSDAQDAYWFATRVSKTQGVKLP
jgi:hypothetical protein